jgi:spermidine synthase
VAEVVVVELEAVIVEWVRTHLRGLTEYGLDDPRVRLVVADIRAVLETAEGEFDAICLDVDNGPGWLVHEANAEVYAAATLALMGRRLHPEGRLAVWTAAPDEEFEARLRHTFAEVAAVSIPVVRGPDDVVYVATAPGAWGRGRAAPRVPGPGRP